MAETKKMLRKLASGLVRSRSPFGPENARLAALPKAVAEARTPQPRHTLAPGIWMDYQPGAGVEVVAGPEPDGEGVRLQVQSTGDSPWFSLSYGIDAAMLRQGRYLGQLLDCSSRGPGRFQVCLRYLLDEGFKDVFARNLVVLTGARQEDLVFIPVDAELAAGAKGAEVLYFFEGRSFDVTLHSAEALLI
ncbi:hypothetical protein [Leisingera sp. ANG-Vp]|uniref:hypothetical protein n=1 Tax=Leisingera sp. ANG-Vp TaxID=1577896 RepID=UPI00057DDE35|nr:hypothetical protein [Leisingera sp. ANG-Vp]KIC15140.1 hypothetical protein RA20_19005 [Leisingera sp. ANG-Vp]